MPELISSASLIRAVKSHTIFLQTPSSKKMLTWVSTFLHLGQHPFTPGSKGLHT